MWRAESSLAVCVPNSRLRQQLWSLGRAKSIFHDRPGDHIDVTS
jgi:hypothetical protein